MKNIMKAVFEFQQECPVIEKLVEGYGYTYADLKGLWDVIKPLMAKHGLAYVFTMSGHTINLTLFHDSGETIVSSLDMLQNVPLAKMNAFQVMGAGITYCKRYMLISALGIITTDTDADNCLPDKTKPVELKPGETVTNAHTGKPVTAKQINDGDIF